MPQTIDVSIVIPAYKEEKRIRKVLKAAKEYEKSHDLVIEVIVVVDGSPDSTAEEAKKFQSEIEGLKIIDRKENKGKGYTVKEGVLAAKGKVILFTDADNSTPLHQLDKLLPFAEDYEVVIGSRYCSDGKLARPQPLTRIIGGRVLNAIIQLLAVRGIRDTQCGFKLFQKDAAKEIFKRQTFDRFSFDIEVLAIARKLGYKTREVGITWFDDPHSTVNPIKDGIRMVEDAWTVRKNITKGKYR